APLSAQDILSRKLLTEAQWKEVADKALALFACGRETAARQGLILVDTKNEFGVAEKGGTGWAARAWPCLPAGAKPPPGKGLSLLTPSMSSGSTKRVRSCWPTRSTRPT